jgi:hypothetical protein
MNSIVHDRSSNSVLSVSKLQLCSRPVEQMPTLTVDSVPPTKGLRVPISSPIYIEFDYKIPHVYNNIHTRNIDEIAYRLRCTHHPSATDCLDYAEFLWIYMTERAHVDPHATSARSVHSDQQQQQQQQRVNSTHLSVDHKTVEIDANGDTIQSAGIQTSIGVAYSIWIVYVDTVLRAAKEVIRRQTAGCVVSNELVRLFSALRSCEQVVQWDWAQQDDNLKGNIEYELKVSMLAVESTWLYEQIQCAIAAEDWDTALVCLLEYGMCINTDFDVDVCTLYAHCMVNRSKHALAVSIWRLLQSRDPNIVAEETVYKSEFLNKQLYGLDIPITSDTHRVVTNARTYCLHMKRLGGHLSPMNRPSVAPPRVVGGDIHEASTFRLAALSTLGVCLPGYTPDRIHDELHVYSSTPARAPVSSAHLASAGDQILVEPKSRPQILKTVEIATPRPLVAPVM